MSTTAPSAVLLDASVLVELVVSGAHVQAADRLLDYLRENPAVEIWTAAHGLIETVSALRRLNLNGLLADNDALTACEWLRGLDLRLDPTAVRIRRTWELRQTMTAYDAAYAAAADGLELPLVTADAPLLAACRTAGVGAIHFDDTSW